MLYEQFGRTELHSRLPESGTEIRLTAYARPRSGLLADGGERWAVLILPGGGYQVTAPTEGEPVALAFLNAGIQAFVLDYSVLPARWPQQLLEAAAALAFIRRNAEKYGVRPDRIAVCGFSAGGHLAGCLANLWGDGVIHETLGLAPGEARPDAAILCYPVVTAGAYAIRECFTRLTGMEKLPPELEKLSLEESVTAKNPPTFLWSTDMDATVPVENTMLYAWALRRKGVSVETHIYNRGPHAMGIATAESAGTAEYTDERAATWQPLATSWLKTLH